MNCDMCGQPVDVCNSHVAIRSLDYGLVMHSPSCVGPRLRRAEKRIAKLEAERSYLFGLVEDREADNRPEFGPFVETKDGRMITPLERNVLRCPWCHGSIHDGIVSHADDCPAFSANGQVRTSAPGGER